MKLKAGADDQLFEFGRFLLDPLVGRLYRDGEEVCVTPKALRVLVVLVERSGRPVEKDEVFHEVWPETFVEENNLARNISMLRKVLRSGGDDDDFIVTLAGRGYQFAAPVTRLSRTDLAARSAPLGPAAVDVPSSVSVTTTVPAPSEAVDEVVLPEYAAAARSAPPARRRVLQPVALAFAAICAIGAGIGLVSMMPREGLSSRALEQRLRQLTSTGIFEAEPSWSPDGRFIVYSSDRGGNIDLWVQPTAGGPAVELTADAPRDRQPAWSPDGRLIAFRSERDGGGLFVVPALGGAIRRVARFGYRPQWSPDGSKILFSHGPPVASPTLMHPYVLNLDEESQTPVLTDFAAEGRRLKANWHPDGRISAYQEGRANGWSFWTVALDGSGAVRSEVASQVEARIKSRGVRLGHFVWAPSGDALYFEGRAEETENIWRVTVDPATLAWTHGPERLTLGAGLESYLALSPDGRQLAFGTRTERTRAWSFPFDSQAGRITGPGEPLTPGGTDSQIVDLSPDGSRLVYLTARDGRDELWIRSLDFRDDRLRTVETRGAILQPRWSRDGTQLAYFRPSIEPVVDSAVVLLGAERGGERVLSASPSPTNVFDWSADGASFLVGCRPSVLSAICTLALEPPHGQAGMRVLAADPERNLFQARGSPDGRWVSFVASKGSTGRTTVFVIPAGGGTWVPVTEGLAYDDKARWAPDGSTLYFLSNRGGFWNLWGRRFDSALGTPTGKAFQVSDFTSSPRMVSHRMGHLQIAVTQDRLILPIVEASGAIWVLDNIDR